MKDLSLYSKLAEITQLINSKLDLHQCLEQVVIAISEEIVTCDSVGIFMAQSDGTFRGYVGKPEKIHGMEIDQLVIDPQTDLLAHEIIEKRKTIYIPDTSMDNRPNPELIEFLRIKSLLALPMCYEEEIFGLVQMFIYNSTMNLTDVEIQTVEAYVNMAAVAIRNAKLFAHKEVLLAEKQLLLDATSELSLCLTIPEVLDTCFRYVGKALNNTNIGAHLKDVLQKKILPLKLSYESDWKEEDWKKVLWESRVDFVDDLVFREVIETKKPIFIPDIDLDHRPNNQICEKFGIKGLLIMPLVAIGEVFGTIAAVSLNVVRNYQESELQLAQSIVDATATALANIIKKEKLEEIVDLRTAELLEKNNMLEKVIADLKQVSYQNVVILNELKSSKLKITKIMEGISDGFIAFDNDYQLTYINSEAQRLIFGNGNEILGKKIWEVLPDIRGSLTYEKIREAMSQRESVHWEAEGCVRPDHYYAYYAYPFEDGLTVFFRDITELKQQQCELSRLERLNLIGQLAAGISHEIRNPLTTVKGFLQLLGARAIYYQEKEYMDLMISEIDRANAIITDFLLLAKANSDNIRLQNINDIINKVFPILQADAYIHNKDIVLNSNLVPDILINENEIKQLILNLVRNGLDATPEHGSVIISTYKKEDKVVLTVKDQGPGIPQELHDKIGTPFFTTKDTGTGLGLAISIGIAQRHKAILNFKTSINGTIFYIAFPPTGV